MAKNVSQQNYLVGIDGGGTKSRLLAVDAQGKILCDVVSGGTNLCALSPEAVTENLRLLFEKANQVIGSHLTLQAAALGTAGISAPNAVEILSGIIYRLTGCERVRVVGDMVLPLYAHAPEGDAMIIIAGTGSICFGKAKNGTESRSGGWGHVFGDEGSAYWLACGALNAVMRAYDGRGEQTVLTDDLLAYWQCKDPTSLVSQFYAKPLDKTEIAQMAVLVSAAADKGDTVATQLLTEAAKHLFELAQGVTRKLNTIPGTILLGGSVLLKNALVRQKLSESLQKAYPAVAIIVTDSAKDAAKGAVALAGLCV